MRYEVIRQFQDRAVAWLLESPEHGLALLQLACDRLAAALAPGSLRRVPSRLAAGDWSQVDEDTIYEATLADGSGVRFVVLVAHQSAPDPFLELRLADAAVRMWRSELAEQRRAQVVRRERRLRRIVPVVLHTGSRPWAWTPLADLFSDDHPELAPYTPVFPVVLVDLAATQDADLAASGSAFGQLLALFKAQHARPEQFWSVLRRTLRALRRLVPELEPQRELLWFCFQLVYHRRGPEEWSRMQETVSKMVGPAEAEAMTRTMADVHREEGRLRGREEGREEGRRSTLAAFLALRFPQVAPGEIEARLRSLSTPEQLAALTRRLAQEQLAWEGLWGQGL